jgi:hypothetical protein
MSDCYNNQDQVFFKVDKNDIYIWRSIVCVCVFVGVPLSCAGQRGQGQKAIDSLSRPKQTRNSSQFEQNSIYREEIYNRELQMRIGK